MTTDTPRIVLADAIRIPNRPSTSRGDAQLTTATKESKPKKAKKKPDDPPAAETPGVETAGGQPSTDSPNEAELLNHRLTDFGFAVPVPLIEQWDQTTKDNVTRTVNRWMEEFVAASDGKPIIAEDRTPVPPLLAQFEQVDPITAKAAQHQATEALTKEPNLEVCNPYPADSALATIWQQALDEARAARPAGDTKPPVPETKGSPPDLTNAANAAELAAKRKENERADRERQRQLAIEAAQHDMEEAVTHQAELEEQLVDMKAEMKELKASFDNAGSRARKAAKALEKARSGVFERTLPFPKAERDATLDVPDQDIGSDGAKPAEPVKPAEPARDDGAFVSLDHLVKGDLQEFIPGTAEDVGISQKQADLLKDKVCGSGSVGDLEKFMRDHGEWWHKQIDGIGPETRGKIEDALAVVRKKFPMPSPDDTPAESNVEVAAEEVIEPMTPEVAKERLEELIEDCKEISENHWQDSACDWGNDVGPKATSMLNNITEHGSVTLPQAKAIRGWMAGADKCLENIDDEPDDENDPFGDDIDVPDEDGDDE